MTRIYFLALWSTIYFILIFYFPLSLKRFLLSNCQCQNSIQTTKLFLRNNYKNNCFIFLFDCKLTAHAHAGLTSKRKIKSDYIKTKITTQIIQPRNTQVRTFKYIYLYLLMCWYLFTGVYWSIIRRLLFDSLYCSDLRIIVK